MPANTATTPTAAELRRHLELLVQERAIVRLEGLDHPAYEADLADEIAAMRNAYVGAAVTEIASMRAALWGPLQG
jgi:hypothetical protein